jgi:transcriptional regulator with GAF, ATPase, and Fis domain
MMKIFEIIGRVAQTDKTALIQGESGTGKDLIAKTIHYNSPRKKKPLVTVDCGALTETLLTSELFGHTKGAFTGAVKDTIGRFQAADGGTLILEEVGEIPFHSQKNFLRVLEDREFERVGSSQSTKVDIRILLTTNRDLREEVRKGSFRDDLYYRLSIVPITIPPLRDRRYSPAGEPFPQEIPGGERTH